MIKRARLANLVRSVRSEPEDGGVIVRIFIAYAGIALLLFALAAAAVLWMSYANVSPKSSMKRMAAAVSADFFIDMLGMEATAMKRPGETTFSGGKIGVYLAERMFHVDPSEPKSLLASELPALRSGLSGGGLIAKGPSPAGGKDGAEPAPGTTDTPGTPAPSSGEGQQPPQTGTGTLPDPPAPGEEAATPDPVPVNKLTTEGRKVVFVYHSHPRESYLPELNVSNVNEAEDTQKNVTLIGKRLAEKLEEQGIGSVHSGTDYPTAVKGYNWNFSYKYSMQTVKEAFVQHKDIAFLFDIHRDSAGRDVTTASIGGKDYAKVYFIVGKKNERWEQNEAFAKRIHDKLEASYPGLSRGIWEKGSGGHAEYNQSVSPNSILVEVGGAYNSLEESYRTADVLAKTIAALYWEAEKVQAPAGASVNGTVSDNAAVAVNR